MFENTFQVGLVILGGWEFCSPEAPGNHPKLENCQNLDVFRNFLIEPPGAFLQTPGRRPYSRQYSRKSVPNGSRNCFTFLGQFRHKNVFQKIFLSAKTLPSRGHLFGFEAFNSLIFGRISAVNENLKYQITILLYLDRKRNCCNFLPVFDKSCSNAISTSRVFRNECFAALKS